MNSNSKTTASTTATATTTTKTTTAESAEIEAVMQRWCVEVHQRESSVRNYASMPCTFVLSFSSSSIARCSRSFTRTRPAPMVSACNKSCNTNKKATPTATPTAT
eukprot:TRINITY_DN3647_c0_g1_i1.p1 TRINITY_DN3647_c0_g1~~TRINITY_DN3647_c0_g1_i1.p1  ORF type:complete len:105 (+),score=28.99 TRINITY_DN3647_c0_g1_i1:612-926(+)